MQDTLTVRLEAARKELLDLGMRNPLLNYRPTSARGLSIVDEKSEMIYQLLVSTQKTMGFGSRSTKKGESGLEELLIPELSQEELEDHYSDNKLQTNESDTSLQYKLLNTFYAANTFIEEQGVNALFLALGMLEWYESENSKEQRLAPLVLVPVKLHRSSARDRFSLSYNENEIQANISLEAKLKTEFSIGMPVFPEPDDFNINSYYENVEQAIAEMSNWKLQHNNIQLGFFSFGKFMIYHDLDSSKWPDDKKPVAHPLLNQLFGEGFSNVQLQYDESSFIDRDTPADKLFQVVDADSSQILSMLAVRQGKDMVIQGPPGTGKSQTITNLIADAIGNNKKVLFVAEKMAALDVVKRRLDSIHLGEACLELHSHKSNKKLLHDELKRILDLGKPTLSRLEQELTLLDNFRGELNDYCEAVNAVVGASGLSVHTIIGHLLQIRMQSHGATLQEIRISNINNWDSQQLIRAEAFAERIKVRLKEIGTPSRLSFWGSKLKVLMPKEEEQMRSLLIKLSIHVQVLSELAKQSAAILSVSLPHDKKDMESIAPTLLAASEAPQLEKLSITDNRWNNRQEEIIDLLNMHAVFWPACEKLEDELIHNGWKESLIDVRTNLVNYGDKWYRFIKKDYNRAIKKLKGLCKTSLPPTNILRLELVDTILETQKLSTNINAQESLSSSLFGERLFPKANFIELKTCAIYLGRIHKGIEASALSSQLLMLLETGFDRMKFANLYQEITDALQHYDSLIATWTDIAKMRLPSGKYSDQLNYYQSWSTSFLDIHKIIAWNNLVEAAQEEGFDYLIEHSIDWEGAAEHLTTALRKTYFEHLLTHAIEKYPALRRFERASHEEVIRRFQEMDRLQQQYNRTKVALAHYTSIPRGEAGGQLGTLKTEFNKRRGHKPIRKLMSEAGHAIQAIKPVFMMSPLSIANFIPPGSVEFDLVIFDEASQVKPVDALGAILRAKQVVVVGDSKQLPPTSFFDSMSKENDDEDNVTADMQSILGLFDAKMNARRMLRWHYRSKHESLITLSNHAFYENKLVIFPSPGSRHRLGLVYHHLPQTAYDRGKTRSNILEAEAVADAVISHAQMHPKQSLGVVAFSTAQKDAILNALEIKRRRQPELENFFNGHHNEPFFVKNLENVQGDERDVIFISIGYGKTAEGFVAMAFGPLTNDGGERRLNVLISRAKMRCEVFTNITADDIDTTRTKSIGIRILKDFLYFAQHGKLHLVEETELGPQSPFEEIVAQQLTTAGYIVRSQVGSHGFYLDLAIVDSQNPGRYLLGIECDGASYHSARSARDRDRLRQQVLEGIGWRIHRIWSTDWFRNPDQELKRVIGAIEKARVQMEVDDAEQDKQRELHESAQAILRETAMLEVKAPVYYTTGRLNESIVGVELHLHPVGKLAEWMEQIVQIESPVHFDEVARRITEAAGIARIGSRIRETLQMAASFAQSQGTLSMKDEFLWIPGIQKAVVRDRSLLPSFSRKLEFIAPEEMMLAIQKTVADAVAIQAYAAIPIIAKMFGWLRVTEEMRESIQANINTAITNNIIALDKEWLKPIKD
ncbi:DUF3320 domain-containing protein [Asinibacterium sp. OR53]|uniref:DUF3320 domain-containing protein n=1 Tax=Asinibacterium sp. OR53 TaxID=925409 RepID=UPI00047D3AE9|nr:DUF3320 domain-containing protein [Asinibacterium sp. OR53]